jgi:carbonic anhydrase
LVSQHSINYKNKNMKGKVISYITRRNLFKLGATAVGTGFVTSQLGIGASQSTAATTQNFTPDNAFDELIQGNKRFASQKTKAANRGVFRLREVAQGQKPFAAILGCADSRVPSEIIFEQGLGDLFVVRVAGNIATPEEIGSLEYGTLVLGAKVLLVLGHERCGAVKAAIDNKPVPGKIGAILEQIQPAVASTSKQSPDQLKDATIANVKNQIAILKSSSVIADLIKSNKLKIVGGFYDLDTGLMTQVA